MKAHFFDVEAVITSQAKVWIVDKSKPSVCIAKIDQSDFNLIRMGIFRNQNNKISFAGVDYYLPDELMVRVRTSAKSLRADASNLAFSMREFLDPEQINMQNHDVDTEVIRHLKNTQDDVYFICSRNTRKSYESIIKKVEEKIEALGISPKYYYISETFYERDEDETSFDKVRLVLQHMVGYRTEGRKFVDEKVSQYDEVYFYDEDLKTTQLAVGLLGMLTMILGNSESTVKDSVKQVVEQSRPVLYVNLVTPNKRNRFSTKRVELASENLIKTFESYKHFGRS